MTRLPGDVRRGSVPTVLATWLGLSALAGCDTATTPAEIDVALDVDFEGASLGSWTNVDPNTVTFSLREDTNAPRKLFFSFRVSQAKGRSATFILAEALSVLPADIWAYTQPVISSDGGESWTRITDTALRGGDSLSVDSNFAFRHTLQSDAEWIALKIPYNFSKWLAMADEIRSEPEVVSIEVIGTTLDGNPLHLVTIADVSVPASQKTGIWVVARQHPGEPGGSYMVEGFMRWLLGGSAQATELLREAEVFVIPFMNPDGVLAGNQRVNLAGLDLNRQWADPLPNTAPTVLAAQDRILSYRDAGGTTRILIDFHSAPTARRNFFFYSEAEITTPELHAEIVDLITLAGVLNPDFIDVSGSVTALEVDIAPRARGWAYNELQTHGFTVESSGNDVTYGPNAGRQQTVDRMLDLGATVGMAVAEQLYDIP